MGNRCFTGAVAPAPHDAQECSICLEALDGDDTLETNCGHLFHRDCIVQALVHNHSCPNCRTEVYSLDAPGTAQDKAKAQAQAQAEAKARQAKRAHRATRAARDGQRAREALERAMQRQARDFLRRQEVQRMREEGFSHYVDAEQAVADYHRRLHRRRRRRHTDRMYHY